jgi:Ran GTPase-activating protein (RanGAP) involved in mRNA processing and transport
VAENDIKSEGTIPFIQSAGNLEVLSLVKNFMRSDVGTLLAKLLKASKVLKKLHLEFNELIVAGAKWVSKGISFNKSLEIVNIKGNIISDEGLVLLASALISSPNLKELDISLNEVGPAGFQALCEVYPEQGERHRPHAQAADSQPLALPVARQLQQD